MGINYSTAKTIVKIYHEQGRAEKKTEKGPSAIVSIAVPVTISGETAKDVLRMPILCGERGDPLKLPTGGLLEPGFWAKKLAEHCSL